jgi:protease II
MISAGRSRAPQLASCDRNFLASQGIVHSDRKIAVEARDEFAVSYDGTRIPVSIIAKKGVTRDGSHPTIVIGYGAYGLSFDPFYNPAWQAWIDQGGVLAVAHIRGRRRIRRRLAPCWSEAHEN